jgi:hypothetical protein
MFTYHEVTCPAPSPIVGLCRLFSPQGTIPQRPIDFDIQLHVDAPIVTIDQTNCSGTTLTIDNPNCYTSFLLNGVLTTRNSLTINTPGSYTVEVTNNLAESGGCPASSSQTVVVTDCCVPVGYTPTVFLQGC